MSDAGLAGSSRRRRLRSTSSASEAPTPSRSSPSDVALVARSASRTVPRAGVSAGKDSPARSTGVPRAGAARFDSEGGSSTSTTGEATDVPATGHGPRVCRMVRGVIRVAGPDPASVVSLERRFAAVRERLGVPDGFPPEVLAAADEAARTPPPSGADLTGVPFVTVDPPGSTDLDQALHLERRGDGYHLDYAIADVPAFVLPGGPVDAEARRRGQTLYAPDKRAPLHPPVLSEAAASLLPDQERRAVVWRVDPDAEGEGRSAAVGPAPVRRRRPLDYC